MGKGWKKRKRRWTGFNGFGLVLFCCRNWTQKDFLRKTSSNLGTSGVFLAWNSSYKTHQSPKLEAFSPNLVVDLPLLGDAEGDSTGLCRLETHGRLRPLAARLRNDSRGTGGTSMAARPGGLGEAVWRRRG